MAKFLSEPLVGSSSGDTSVNPGKFVRLMLLFGGIFIVCIVSLLLYLLLYGNDKGIEYLGNIGCGISGVAGLLAFGGMLFSAYQAEKRASEAKKELDKQLLHAANRDWFNSFIEIIGKLLMQHYKLGVTQNNASLFDENLALAFAELRKMDIFLDTRPDTPRQDNVVLSSLINAYLNNTKVSIASRIDQLKDIIEKAIVVANNSKIKLFPAE